MYSQIISNTLKYIEVYYKHTINILQVHLKYIDLHCK